MSAGRLVAGCLVLCVGSGLPPALAQDGPRHAQAPGPAQGGQATDSIAELEQALASRPDDLQVNVTLGLAYLTRGDTARALERLQHAVHVAPRSAEAHNWLGVVLLDTADGSRGIAALRTAISLDPAYSRAYVNLGSALAERGELDEAVQVFRKALEIDPRNMSVHFNLGLALRGKGDLEAALQHLRRVAEADPGSATIQYELGQTLQQSGALEDAIAAFERALAIDPERREGYYALGAALKRRSAAVRTQEVSRPSPANEAVERGRAAMARREFDAAKEALAEAIQLDADHAEAHTVLGFVLGQLGDLKAAVPHLRRAAVLRPEWSEARYNLGAALWYSGARQDAIAELRESVRLDPAAAGGHAFLGMALRETGDSGAARASLQRAIALAPELAAAYVDLGVCLLSAGNLENGIGLLEAGLNVPSPVPPPPDWDAAIAAVQERLASGSPGGEASRAYNVLGLMLGRKGAPAEEVVAAFRAAIRLKEDDAEAHNHLGLVLIQSGNDEEGLAALRQAVRLAPGYADARTNLGAALAPTDADAAIAELEEAVRLAPGSIKALFNLAVAYGRSPAHGPAKEIEHLERVIAMAPAFPRAHLSLGKARLRQGQVQEAIAALEEAARLQPESGEAWYQLGLALARAGRKEEAAAALAKGRALVAESDRAQNANLDFVEGRAALNRGDLEAAVVRLRRAAHVVPDSPDVHRHLGSALEKGGDRKGAAAAYRRALELSPADAAAKRSLDRLAAAEPGSGDDRARVAELETYIREGRYAEVEPLLEAYVTDRPHSSWGWYALGYSQFAQRKIGQSIKALARSLQLDVRNAEAHKILGRNLMIIGRFDAARIEFEQAIRYKPDSAESHYNLGKLYSIQDNWEPARKAFEAALRIEPGYIEAVDALGFALEALGDDEGARARYEEAIALNEQRAGGFAGGHVNLSAFYNRTGQWTKALEHAAAALAIDPGSDRAWFQKGRADERLGNLTEAIEALNRAIVENPHASSYYYVLAGVYRRHGWMDESRKALDEFRRLEKESSELEKLRRNVDAADLPGPPRE